MHRAGMHFILPAPHLAQGENILLRQAGRQLSTRAVLPALVCSTIKPALLHNACSHTRLCKGKGSLPAHYALFALL